MRAPFTELLASLVALKVRSQTGGAVELSAFLNKTGAEWSAEALAVARAGSQSRFVMRNRPVQMLYQTNRYRGYYGPAFPTSPENLARLERLSAQDPEFNWGSLLLRPVEQDVLVLSLVDGQREIPVASFKVPALYEGDKFEPLDKMPALVRERYEAEKRRLAAIPPR
jgi:hypothetical protein